MHQRHRVATVSSRDGTAILDIERGTISTLNSTGAFAWERLERGETPETIIANLAREKGESIPIVECDVREFL
jgi:hypothetical protein